MQQQLRKLISLSTYVDIILSDRRIGLEVVFEILNMSYKRVHHILYVD